MNDTAKLQARLALALVATIAIVGAAGCGGGGDGSGSYFPAPVAAMPPPAPADPPAMQSPYDSFIAYLKGIVETALDNAEPADVTAFDPPPVSDVLEPVATQ